MQWRRATAVALGSCFIMLAAACGGSHRDAEDADDADDETNVEELLSEQELQALRDRVPTGKAAPHASCKDVGEISGTGGGGGFTTTDMKMRDAQDELRFKTEAQGGNFALMDAIASDVYGITITGRALNCGAPPTAGGSGGQESGGSASDGSPKERLRKLEELRGEGLITDEEYERRRKEIIDEI